MGNQTIKDKIRKLIAGLAFRMFLKMEGLTEEKYWEIIYQQEKAYKESQSTT